MFNIENGTIKCINTFEGHNDGIIHVEQLQNNKHLSQDIKEHNSGANRIISVSYDLTLKIWNLESGNCDFTSVGNTWIDSSHFVFDFNDNMTNWKIISASRNYSLKIWNFQNGKI